jgi:hypothetical protein
MRVKKLLRNTALTLLLASGVAWAGGVVAGLGLSPAVAQNTGEGLTIFGGVDAEYRLGYSIDNNKRRDIRARYYLRVTGRKLPRPVTELEITYPPAFEENGGHLNNVTIEVRAGDGRGGAVIEADEISLDTQNNTIEIYLKDPIPANTSFVIVMANVRNPNRFGVHYFNLQAMFQGDVLRQFVGIWPMDIAVE